MGMQFKKYGYAIGMVFPIPFKEYYIIIKKRKIKRRIKRRIIRTYIN